MDGAVTAFSDWLHKLPPDKLAALRAFRAAARAAYPDDKTPAATALSGTNVPAVIRDMPADYVKRIDH